VWSFPIKDRSGKAGVTVGKGVELDSVEHDDDEAIEQTSLDKSSPGNSCSSTGY